MKKNVVFWVGVKNEKYSEKYGGWDWMDITRKSWEYWCKKHDVIFFPMEKPIEEDLTRFRINWQKAIYCFDILDEAGIDYDQIYLVDGMNIVKWDTPNVFELTNHKFTAWRDTDNLGWTYKSIVGYNDFFDGYKFDKEKYFSSGLIIFNEQHKEVFRSFKKMYHRNIDEFVDLQDRIVRKGTEQTPLNYHLQMNNIDINLDLPFSYKLCHIHRKEMFKHSWQLNEDMTPFFIKYGHVWGFSGLPKNQRTDIISQTWDLVKHNYDENHFLNKLAHKDEWCKTTSRKFKEDILRIFGNRKDLICLEIGSCRGDTTRVFAECFKTVYSFEQSDENLKYMKEKCSDVDNIIYSQSDVYDNFEIPDVDVVFVDAGHSTELVKYDIKRFLEKNKNMILIFDDYGQRDESIKKAIVDSNLPISRYIGEYNGFTCTNMADKEVTFVAREGVICNMD
jgi:hypothetical protein